jgi:hypothetical protein
MNPTVSSPQSLVRLTDANYEVAPGDPDVRGWEVILGSDEAIGEVDDLIIDPSAGKVRYLDVELDRKAVGLERDRHVLIPISTAQIDTGDEQVVLAGLNRATLLKLPEYDGTAYAAGYDQTFRSHLSEEAQSRRVTRSAEELRIGKRPEQRREEADADRRPAERAVGFKEEVEVNRSPGNVLFKDDVKGRGGE